MDLLKVQKS